MSEKDLPLKQMLRFYPRTFRLIWAASPRYASITTLLSVTRSLMVPAQIWLSKVIIDAVIEIVQNSAPDAIIDWTTLFLPISALIVVMVLGELSERLADSFQTILRFLVEHHAHYVVLQKAAQLDIAFYENANFYDQLDIARSDGWRMHNLAKGLTESIGHFLSLGVTLALVARLSPWTIPILLLITAPQLIISTQFANSMFHLFVRQTTARRMVEYLSQLLVSRDAIKEIHLFGLQHPLLTRFRDFWQQFFGETIGIMLIRERKNVLLLFLSAAGVGAIWAYAIVQAVLGRITIGDLTLVFQAVARVRSDLNDLFRRGGIFYESGLYLDRFFSFLDIQPDDVAGSLTRQSITNHPRPHVPKPLQKGIEFCDVSFHYPGNKQPVLQNLSFAIPPGTSVAVVGENGAGKTTLVKLLARFYDPTDGTILLDGRDLRDYDVANLQRHIGIIFQDFVRYNLTARENVGFGQLDLMDDEPRIVQAAAQGGAASIIDGLPQRLDTMLGRQFESSVDLSGGEWQKLALSRAFMREAQILILDEPTAALDALAEYDIYKRFADLTVGRMTFFISHRFSTVRMAQQILVLQSGRLIETGSHETLMSLDGQYATMFNVQAERYQ